MNPHAPTPTSPGPPITGHPPLSPPPPDPGTPSPDGNGPHGLPPLPPKRPQRHRPNLWRPGTLALAVGVAFAVGTPGSPLRSIGWALALSVLIGALVTTAAKRPAAIGLGLAGAAFVPWLAVRMSPWLISVNLLMAGGLLVASLGLPAAGSLRVPVTHHVLRLLRAVGRLPLGPSHLAMEARRSGRATGMGTIRRLLPSALVGMATLGIGLLVLASGDALLASFFDFGNAVGEAVVRVVAALGGVMAFAVMVGAIHVSGTNDAAPNGWSPAPMPTLFGIGGLSVAIGAYAATQISAAVLGADFVEDRTGLTYAEYARSGFFQMVAVALMSVAAIGVARSVLRTSSDASRRIRLGAAVLTVGVVVTVVSAIVKLSVYADTFGLTMLRVYTVVFACWIGLLALLAFAALLRHSASWFAPVMLGSICVGAFAMNIANPERIVAEHNIERAETTGKLDVGYLAGLSLDAAPTIVSKLDTISAVYEDRTREGVGIADAAEVLSSQWCHRVLGSRTRSIEEAPVDNGGLSFNAARGAALDSADQHCP